MIIIKCSPASLVPCSEGQRKVAEGEPFYLAPGEEVIGSDASNVLPDPNSVLLPIVSYLGMETAEFVRAAAKALNASGLVQIDMACAACDLRYRVLHSIRQIGIHRSIRLIIKSLRGTITDEEESLIKETYKGD